MMGKELEMHEKIQIMDMVMVMAKAYAEGGEKLSISDTYHLMVTLITENK